MSSDIDFDFDPTLTLMRLAWKTGNQIGRELRRNFDNQHRSKSYNVNPRPNVDYQKLKPPLFDYDKL